MAVVRDPYFWKRFSVAVHQDEESSIAPSELKHTTSWLDRQNKKRARRTCICWIFWIGFSVFVAGMVVVILWLQSSGILANIGQHPTGDTLS